MPRHATVSRVTDDSRLHELLHAASQGNRQAADELLPLVYHELRRMAQAALAHEAKGRTLQPTALVHEAWLRLVENGDPGWDGRRHFVGAAARAMRRILVDEARRREARKPSSEAHRTGLEEPAAPDSAVDPDAILDLDALLTELEQSDPRRAEIIHLRFFAGLGNEETAQAMGLSVATIEREWRFAKAILARRLGD